MKIKTGVKIVTAASFFVTSIAMAVSILTGGHVREIAREAGAFNTVIEDINGLRGLTYDYLLHPTERAGKQWLLVHDDIGRLLAASKMQTSKDLGVFEDLKERYSGTHDIFERTIQIHENETIGPWKDAVLKEAESRLTAQLLIETQSMVSDVAQLASSLNDRSHSALLWADMMNRCAFALVLLFILLNSLYVYTSVVKPILKVHQGIGIVASGRLDHKVGITIRNEVGDLSETFDHMTDQLKATMVSRDELELRIRERTKELGEANQALSEKAEIIDLAHDAILVCDSESKITFWSRGAGETFGYTREEALGQVSNDLLKTVFPVPVESIMQSVLEKGEWKGELRHTKSNGERIIVDSRWAVQAGGNGKTTGFLQIDRDITSRRIIEEEFRKVDRAFRTLSECNQAMVRQTDEMELLRQVCRIVVEAGGYRLAWVGFAQNDENKTVLPVASAGYDQGYLEQAKVSWSEDERGRGPIGTAVRTGKIVATQSVLLNPTFQPWRAEGTKRGYASVVALPLIVDRKVIGTLTIYASEPDAFDEGESSLLSNLAENLAYGIASIRLAELRERSEEELRIYASRLEIINKELQDFAFAAAHDLQEPLRKIQTFCDMAVKRCASGLDSAGREYLDRVTGSAERMRQLLRDLLTFSRAAEKPEPFKRIDLGKVSREAADVFEVSIRETGCHIEIGNMPVIEADESQIRQLFQNLVGNALRFRGEEAPSIKIHGKLDGPGICEICVKDNGIGFEQQYAELIFRPFQRLHSRSQYEGTGMGLAICRKIVERHGGAIRAESEPGKGATFVIRLPVKQARVEDANSGKQS